MCGVFDPLIFYLYTQFGSACVCCTCVDLFARPSARSASVRILSRCGHRFFVLLRATAILAQISFCLFVHLSHLCVWVLSVVSVVSVVSVFCVRDPSVVILFASYSFLLCSVEPSCCCCCLLSYQTRLPLVRIGGHIQVHNQP